MWQVVQSFDLSVFLCHIPDTFNDMSACTHDCDTSKIFVEQAKNCVGPVAKDFPYGIDMRSRSLKMFRGLGFELIHSLLESKAQIRAFGFWVWGPEHLLLGKQQDKAQQQNPKAKQNSKTQNPTVNPKTQKVKPKIQKVKPKK